MGAIQPTPRRRLPVGGSRSHLWLLVSARLVGRQGFSTEPTRVVEGGGFRSLDPRRGGLILLAFPSFLSLHHHRPSPSDSFSVLSS